MAVFQSFELQGKKQSFANWISNLSPCETPFTSLIGKEGISQAQYSWQTDTLAPADNHSYEEGSQVASQSRASTKELTNFTSTLRKVVHITKTAEAVATYGKGSEVGYQMAKAGKELMRDLEWMNLSNINGNPGTGTLASRFAGFQGLVAGLGVSDVDTGAVVHKSAEISVQGVHTNIDPKDIFDITYNLYLAGSKADKIMFHPQHAIAFSSMVSGGTFNGQTYRMFDNVSSVYNSFVSKIRDPLGRVYTLIPNRNMPLDQIYFFTESDWTQMVLREPKKTTLSVSGSSERHLVEMEVGLRHAHPYASGILNLVTKNITNTFVSPKVSFTASLGETAGCNSAILVDNVAEADLDVYFYTSNSSVVTFEKEVSKTAASGRASNKIIAGSNEGFAEVWTVCKGVKSNTLRVVVGYPLVELSIDNHNPNINNTINLTATIKKANGSAVTTPGLKVKWYVNPNTKLELGSVTIDTDDKGVATTTAKVLSKEEILVQAVFDNNVSNSIVLNYVPKPAIVEVTANPNTFAEIGTSDGSAQVLDSAGQPLQGITVAWTVEPQNVASTDVQTSVTDSQGIAVCTLTGQNRGQGKLKAVTTAPTQVFGECDIFVGTNAHMDFTINPNPTKVGEVTEFRVALTGQDGEALPDVEVKIKADMGGALDLTGMTDSFGVYSDRITFTSNSDLEVTASISSFSLSETQTLTFSDSVIIGAPKIEVSVTPASCQVGEDSTATVTYKDGHGAPVESAQIRFLTTPTWSDSTIPDLVTDNTGKASLNFSATKAGDYMIRAQVTGSNPTVESEAVAMKFTSVVSGGIFREPEILTRPIAIGGKSNAKIVLTGSNGMPLRDEVVTWVVEPSNIVTAAAGTTTTDQNGMSLLELTGISKGIGKISYSCAGEFSQITHFHVGQGTSMDFSTDPVSPKVNGTTKISSTILRNEDNKPVQGVDVTFSTNVAVGGFPVTVKTDANGVASFENFFPSDGDFLVTAVAPEFSHSEVIKVVVQKADESFDTPYAVTYSGHNVKLTHDTLQTSTITTKYMLWGSPAIGVRLDVRSLDPHIAVATALDTPTNSKGEYSFTVRGTGRGTARLQVKARNNAGNWTDIAIQVGSPTLEVIVSPTTMSAGTTVEFAAVYKDSNGNWAPGMEIRWEHPKTMLNGQQTIPNAVTDQFGRTFYSNKAGAWATHTFRAILVSNDAIRSVDKSITVHM